MVQINKFNDFNSKCNSRYPDIVYSAEKKTGRLFGFYEEPESIRRHVKSTNAIEKLNEEIRGIKLYHHSLILNLHDVACKLSFFTSGKHFLTVNFLK